MFLVVHPVDTNHPVAVNLDHIRQIDLAADRVRLALGDGTLAIHESAEQIAATLVGYAQIVQVQRGG